MRSRDSRNEFHDFIFRQIVDGEQFFSHNAFEAFMKYAEARGFSDVRILTMAESGMSGAEIFAAVESGTRVETSSDSRMC